MSDRSADTFGMRTTAIQASPVSIDDLSPAQTADKLVQWTTAKTRLPLGSVIVLGILAGVFIALGGALFTLVMVDVPLGHGPSRLLGGFAFSIGLLLVCMTGAELSTGNCMGFAAAAQGTIGHRDLIKLLVVSYVANIVGALLMAGLVIASGLDQGPIGQVTARIAEAKLATPLVQAYFRGILCNALVCFAVWMILAARSLPGKMIGAAFPITAFVALGLEHSIANVYLVPVGISAGAQASLPVILAHLYAVTFGNLVGGAVVALAFWWGHLRKPAAQPLRSPHGAVGPDGR